MALLSKLFIILAMLVPPGSEDGSEPIVPGSSAVPRAVRGQDVCFPAICPAHLPIPTESYFERLDETALDEEEDSTRVEDHGLALLTFPDYEAPRASHRLFSLSPVNPHARLSTIAPILRC
jgi:hypothetical protein